MYKLCTLFKSKHELYSYIVCMQSNIYNYNVSIGNIILSFSLAIKCLLQVVTHETYHSGMLHQELKYLMVYCVLCFEYFELPFSTN